MMSTDTTIPDANGVARDQLRAFIERVERVEEEIATLNTDKSDIYKEARAVGFDVKVLRKVVAKRKLETHVREEQDAIFDMYWEALYGAPVQVHTRTRENIEEFRSDNSLNIQTKHEDIRTAPETAEEAEPEAAAEVAGNDLREPVAAEQGQIIWEGDAPRETDRLGGDASCLDTEFQMDRATEGSFETGSEAAEKGREAIPAGPEGVDLNHAGAGESPATDQPLTGGDHEEVDDHRRAMEEGAASALPIKPKYVLRPHCLNPGPTCGGHGSNHCGTCKRAMAEKSEVAA